MFCSSLKKLALFPVIVFLLFQTTLADYVFYHRIGEQIEPITLEEYSKIHPIVLDYQFPMCLGNPRLLDELKPDDEGCFDLVYNEEGFIQKRINELKIKGLLPQTLEMIFIPKTVYELCFILDNLEYLKDRKYENASKVAMDAAFPIKILNSKLQDQFYEAMSTGLIAAKKQTKDSVWNEKCFYETMSQKFGGAAVTVVWEFNNIIVKLMQNYKFNGYWRALSSNIMQRISEIQADLKQSYQVEKELEKLNRDDSTTLKIFYANLKGYGYSVEQNKSMTPQEKRAVIIDKTCEKLHALFGNKWDGEIEFLLKDVNNWDKLPRHIFNYPSCCSGYYFIFGIVKSSQYNTVLNLDAKTQDIVLQAIDVEMKAKNDGTWVLYRGSELKDGKEQLTQEGKPYSLSYGNSLFAGLMKESGPNGAMAFTYIGNRGGYAICIPIANYLMNGLSRKLFFIAPILTFCALYLYGEFFHSRSRVFVNASTKPFVFDPNDRFGSSQHDPYSLIHGFCAETRSEKVALPVEYIRADLNHFKTQEAFEATFHDFLKPIFLK
ncbi:MAG: hypothetical protein US49_C0006G0177 [candidate division TM6 bacterium GW2011_GWF2_37_49]|nr:MAG: hypothetical protein US49_C0006G0177 [candidate division TM6 bacterium GW2011_GWF2_37_49]